MPYNRFVFGLHHAPNEYYVGDRLRFYLEEQRQMGMGLAVTMSKDEYTFRLLLEYGIVPIFRPQITCADDYMDLSGVYAMKAAGIADPRVQIYNEPSDSREWPGWGGTPANYMEIWIRKWIDAAQRVYHAGGWPGIQCLDPEEELRPLLQEIKRRGLEWLLEKVWMSVHNYTSSHPPKFPYDGLETRVKGPDGEFVKNADGSYKWATVYDREGHTSFMVPLAFDKVFQEEIGRSVETWVTEGGWAIGDHDDNRYPKVTPELHKQYHLEVVTAFRNGELPTGEAWPRWLKGFTFWIAASTAMGGPMEFDANAWYYSQVHEPNTLVDTIDALKVLAGGKPIQPTFEEPEPEEPEEEPVAYTYELDFARYASQYPERVGQPISPLVQIGASEAVQRTEKGVLWWDGQTTLYVPYVAADAEVAQLRAEVADLQGRIQRAKEALGEQ